MKNIAHPMDRVVNWCSHGGWFTLAISKLIVDCLCAFYDHV